MVIPNYSSADIYDAGGVKLKSFKGANSHFENFIAAVRSRDAALLTAPIEEGHVSAALCHTANISFLVGREMPPEQMQYLVWKNRELNDAFVRMRAHLTANKVDIHAPRATMGMALAVDPQAERFTNSHKANSLLKRKYRKPFVVPEIA